MIGEYLPALVALGGVHLMAVASPGPAFVSTVRLSAGASRGSAVAHAAGLAMADAVWALAAMLGLSAVMLGVALLYRVLQLLGGAYLIYSGVQGWRHSRDELVIGEGEMTRLSEWAAFGRGLATNLGNPKVVVFFASISAALMNAGWPMAVKGMVPLN